MLTKSQEEALKLIERWIQSGGTLFRLGGPAGSGKSYLIPIVADIVGREKCLFMTPTGKAANNLQKAGLQAQTIHSTIYRVRDEGDDEDVDDEDFVASPDREFDDKPPQFLLKDGDAYRDTVSLFIVDEASMVGGSVLTDLLRFGIPILLVGDPNQLLPVNDTSVYTKCEYYLEEIVRQAKDSPIIWLSQQALQGNLCPGVYGTCMVRQGGGVTDAELHYASIVLTDTNAYRNELNQRLRQLRFGELPASWLEVGDSIIFRTNCPSVVSDTGFGLTNGTTGIVEEIKHLTKYKADIVVSNPDLGTFSTVCTNTPRYFPAKKRPPTAELGYALTVHLSQGSEWDNEIYAVSTRPTRRAMYTAITRAKKSLLITI